MARSAIYGYSPPFDALDVLVLSQGYNVMSYGVSEYDLDKFGRVMGMNVGSFMACALKFKPMLSASGGNIVMLSSIASLMAIPGAPAYCASKFAVTGLCRSLARGWAAETVRVNAIGPGVIPSLSARARTVPPKYTAAVIASNPLRRLAP